MAKAKLIGRWFEGWAGHESVVAAWRTADGRKVERARPARGTETRASIEQELAAKRKARREDTKK